MWVEIYHIQAIPSNTFIQFLRAKIALQTELPTKVCFRRKTSPGFFLVLVFLPNVWLEVLVVDRINVLENGIAIGGLSLAPFMAPSFRGRMRRRF